MSGNSFHMSKKSDLGNMEIFNCLYIFNYRLTVSCSIKHLWETGSVEGATEQLVTKEQDKRGSAQEHLWPGRSRRSKNA